MLGNMAVSGFLDLQSHFGLRPHQPFIQEEEDEEPVHPLDLRICKVDETISRKQGSNVFDHEPATSAASNHGQPSPKEPGPPPSDSPIIPSVSPPTGPTDSELRLRSPMQSAFPGQIPPDRRYSETSSEVARNPLEAHPMLALRPFNELQASVQQQLRHRYHPYASEYKPPALMKSATGPPESVPQAPAPRVPSKNAFLRHVLQNRDVPSSQNGKINHHPHHPNHPRSYMKAEPVDHAIDIDRRMEALDQRLRLNERTPGGIPQHPFMKSGHHHSPYSPPSSPPTLGGHNAPPPPLCFDPEQAVRRHREFLRKLQEGHFFNGGGGHHGGGFGPQSPLSPPDFSEDYGANTGSPPPLEPLSPLCESLGGNDGLLGQKGKRGRPRKHAIKIPLPPLYVFIRNLLHNRFYNPRVVSWVCEYQVNTT